MKKAVFVFALALAVSMTLAAQAGNEQRLLGSWTNLIDDTTVVFYANGTVSGLVFLEMDFTRWAVAGESIALFEPGDETTFVGRFYFSGDGRTLIISLLLGQGLAFRRN